MSTKQPIQKATPQDIADLVPMARDKTNWSKRLNAVEELGKWNCQQAKDVLWRLMLHDKVYKVQETAFRKLQAFGEDVKLPRKKKGAPIKDINKKLVRIRNSFDGTFTFDEFKEKFRQREPKAFDVYRFEKRSKFDTWLEKLVDSLPKK